MGNRILVTGGCGMIGSNLVKRLVKEGNDVYVIDNLWRGKLEYLNDETGKPVIDLDTHFFNTSNPQLSSSASFLRLNVLSSLN